MTNKYQKKLFDKKVFLRLIEDKWKVAGIIFLVFSLLFGLKMPQTIIGYGDSDMFVVAGYKLGLMRSPGYPIYTLLLFLFTHLPFVSNPAVGGHVLSVISGALSLSLVFLTSWQLYENHKSKKYTLFSREIERLILSLISTGILAISSLFWSASIVTEKYAFGGLIFAAFLWLSTMRVDKKKEAARLNLLSIVLGIGLTHQLIFVSLIPVYLFVLYEYFGKKDFSKAGKYIATVVATVSVSVSLLWIYAGQKLNMSPILGDGIGGLFDYLRAGYLTNGTGENSFAASFSLSNVLVNVWEMSIYVIGNLYWIISLPIVFLALYIQKTKKFSSDFIRLGITFVATMIVSAIIVVWPESGLDKQKIVFEFVYVLIALAPLIWFGFAEMITRLGEAGAILFKRSRVDWFMSVVSVLPILLLCFAMVGKDSLANYDAIYLLNRKTLESVDEKSIVECYSYSSCQSLLYLQEIEEMRKDVALVPFYFQPGQFNSNFGNLQGFDYKTYPLVLYDITTWNLRDRSVYAVDIFQDYYDLFGTNFGFMYIVPNGYIGKFSQSLPKEFAENDYSISEKIIEDGKSDWKLLTDNSSAAIARRHMLSGSILMKMGFRNEAMLEANLASNIYHLIGAEEAAEVLMIKEGLEKTMESKYYKPGAKVESVDYIINSIKPLVDVKLIGRALDVAQGAVTVDPRSVKARLAWADMFLLAKFNDRAIEEYKNVLKLDPGNKDANEGIAKATGQVTEDDKPALFN